MSGLGEDTQTVPMISDDDLFATDEGEPPIAPGESASTGKGKERTRGPPVGEKVIGPDFLINVPDLRNGSLVNIQQAAPRASMSVLYHWTAITDLRHTDYIDTVEYVIRATYAQLLHATGGAVTEVVTDGLRKRAIVLGSVRAGATAAYKLTSSDLTRSECVPAGIVFDRGHVSQSAAGTTSSARWTMAKSMRALGDSDSGVISMCVYMGMAIPAIQGVSLVMTGHHYIPTTYSLFNGIKKQALGSVAPDTKAWIDGMGETFDDMAFHKACHPISPTLKRELAKSVDVRERLKASGHGSAAIRLPAVPSEASGGKAAVALIRSASATIARMGHSVSADTGEALLLTLEHTTNAVDEALACNAVITWIEKNSAALAFCAGIVTHVHETTGVGKNTILSAYSIRRIVADHPAEAAEGATYSRAATARMRAQMEDGTYADPKVLL